MIARAAIEERLLGLVAEQNRLLAALNVHVGAIEDCQYWLSVIDEGAGIEPAPSLPEEASDEHDGTFVS